jgi:hypothetical protein
MKVNFAMPVIPLAHPSIDAPRGLTRALIRT